MKRKITTCFFISITFKSIFRLGCTKKALTQTVIKEYFEHNILK